MPKQVEKQIKKLTENVVVLFASLLCVYRSNAETICRICNAASKVGMIFSYLCDLSGT